MPFAGCKALSRRQAKVCRSLVDRPRRSVVHWPRWRHVARPATAPGPPPAAPPRRRAAHPQRAGRRSPGWGARRWPSGSTPCWPARSSAPRARLRPPAAARRPSCAFNPAARRRAGRRRRRHPRRGSAITDLAATVLAEDRRASSTSRSGPRPSSTLGGRAQPSASSPTLGRSAVDVAGVGIGLPGPVEHATGRPRNPPIMPGWDGFDVPGYVGAALGAAVVADNDVNVMALGERFLGFPDGRPAAVRQGRHRHRLGDHQPTAACTAARTGAAGDLGHVQVAGPRRRRCAAAATAAASRPSPAERRSPAGCGSRARRGRQRRRRRPGARRARCVALQEVRQAGRDDRRGARSAREPAQPDGHRDRRRRGRGRRPAARRRARGRLPALAPARHAHLRIVRAVGERAGIIGAACLAIDEILAPDAVDDALAATA